MFKKFFLSAVFFFILYYALANITGLCPCKYNVVEMVRAQAGNIGEILTKFSKGESTKKKPPKKTTSSPAKQKSVEEMRMDMIDRAMRKVTETNE